MPLAVRRKHRHFYPHCVLNWIFGVPGARWLAGIAKGTFGVISTLSAAFLILLSFLEPPDPNVTGKLESALGWVHENRFAVCCVMLIFEVVSGLLIWLLGFVTVRRLNRRKAKSVLNWLVDKLFEDRQADHVYRATLFKVRRFWGFGWWLGIVARSGETYPKGSTIFCINPHTKAHNTGVAGECWWRAQNNTGECFRIELPDCRASPDDAQMASLYKTQGYVDDCEHGIISVLACYFHVTVIRLRGRVWGVLIVDSTDTNAKPSTKPQTRKQDEAMRNAAEVIRLLIG